MMKTRSSALHTPVHLSPSWLRQLFQHLGSIAPFAVVTLVFLAMVPPTLLAMALDTRQFQDDNIWLKPLKFELSLVMFFGTVAWFGAYTSQAFRQSANVRRFAYVACLAALAEIIWIAGAALYGVASHFNQSSAFMESIYGLMGVFAVTLTAAALVVGIGVLRHKDASLHPHLRSAIGWSMILTFVATVLTAGYMASGEGHLVGPESHRAAHWLTGWSTQVGDLRVAHFFATHTMHFVPAVVLLAVWSLPTALSRATTVLSLPAYAALVTFSFFQAVSGQPFITA